jgi:rhodanese-related sulfurtransferase
MSVIEGFKHLVGAARARIVECSADELDGLLAAAEPLVLVDVREPDEYAAGHLPGAVALPRGVVEFRLPDITSDPEQLIVCYCGSGGRSALATDSLLRVGYQRVLSLAGGIQAWSAAGKPVVTD